VLFLVGDAGAKEFDDNPVLQHMKAAVRALDARGVPTTVLFLGDNVYEEGVREDRPEDLRLLGAQVQVVSGTSAKGIFLAGNHDWGDGKRGSGVARLMNQEQAIGGFNGSGADVGLMPPAGCPGPQRENLEDSAGDALAALVLLDTPWWILEPSTDSRCNSSTKEDVIRGLDRVLSEESDLPIIVAAHHPLRSGGLHGGNASYFRRLASWAGFTAQNLDDPRYQTLIESFTGAFGRTARLIIYVAGHDHTLQVIEESMGSSDVLHLVSGSGSKVAGARPIDGSRFAAGLPGYMRLDFRSGGRIQLGVVAECTGEAFEANLCRRQDAGRFQTVYRLQVR